MTRTYGSELERLIAEQAADMRWGHRVIKDGCALGTDGEPLIMPGSDRLRASDDRHGTSYCYHRLGCRCDRCRACMAAESRDYRRRKKLAQSRTGAGSVNGRNGNGPAATEARTDEAATLVA